MESIDLHSLWNFQSNTQKNLGLYINYIPNFAERELRNIFYNPSMPNIPVEEIPKINKSQINAFKNEIIGSKEYQECLESFPKLKAIKIFMLSISHRVDGIWLDNDLSKDLINVSLEVKIGNQILQREFDLDISTLSSSSKEVIAKLNIFTKQISYQRYLSTLNFVNQENTDEFPHPKKIKVFISYRKKDSLAQAKQLHEILQSYANASIFEPILDVHDLELGDWDKQLMDKLESCDIFCPIITKNFSEKDSYSKKEVDIAIKRNREGNLSIAPFFLSDSSFIDLSNFQGCNISQSSITIDDVDDFLGKMSKY